MDTLRRSTPSRLAFAALALLAVASFTGFTDSPVVGTSIRPPEVDSPIERGGLELLA
jgi:hypothetical protein